MILKFLKDAPSKNGKKYKANTQDALSDHQYGNKLIEDGFAVRVDNVPNTIGSILKEERKNKLKK